MAEQRTGKEILLNGLRNGLLFVVGLLAAAYVSDYLIVRIRIATHGRAFDDVTVRTVYAVPHKDRTTEYMVGEPQQQTCVRSLFPHMGDAPCWYLRRHPEQRIDM